MLQNTQIEQATLSSSFMLKVFGLVGYAMGISAVAVFLSPVILEKLPFLGNPIISLILVIGIIFTGKFWATKEPLNLVIFTLLAGLLGLSISPLIGMALAVDPMLVMKAFISTACLSVAAGVYGATTKKDMSGMGGFLVMALIGMIVVGIINMIWPSSMVSMLISGVGVILFSIFIAYDINTLKHYPENMAIMAAIGLYLSIFNLFQSILSLLLNMNSDD